MQNIRRKVYLLSIYDGIMLKEAIIFIKKRAK